MFFTVFFIFIFNLISFFYLSRVVTEKPHKGSVNKLLCCIVLWYREISAVFSGYASLHKLYPLKPQRNHLLYFPCACRIFKDMISSQISTVLA